MWFISPSKTGLITLEGSENELLNDPKVNAAYLGAHWPFLTPLEFPKEVL